MAAEAPLALRAATLVISTQHGGTATLQRRLGVSFLKAGELMDELERRGIVGPVRPGGQRAVLVSREQWDQVAATWDAL